MTDYRALCARMADELDRYRKLLMNDRRATHALATEARAALAQPEPQGVSDEAIMQLACISLGYEYTPSLLSSPENGIGALDALPSELLAFARAVLARWGRPAIKPVPQQEAE
jgi:hypothetical protein